MNISRKDFRSRSRFLAVALTLLAAGALGLRAQTDPQNAAAPSPAALNQDVQSLQRLVSQLQSQLDQLTQANERLQKQILSPQDIKNLVDASVQNALAKNRADTGKDIDQASEKLHTQILAEVSAQIKELASQTDAQLKKLAVAIGDRQAVTPVSTPPPPRTPLPPDTKIIPYTVKSGDTLEKISGQFKVKKEDILAANQIADPNKLRAGQLIGIPQKDGAALPAPAPGK